jgi:hypothetical protein
MSEAGRSEYAASSLAPFLGFAVGALLGVVFATLFTPANGRPRRRLGKAARLIRDAGAVGRAKTRHDAELRGLSSDSSIAEALSRTPTRTF